MRHGEITSLVVLGILIFGLLGALFVGKNGITGMVASSASGNINLTVWDTTDIGMPYATGLPYVYGGQTLTILANFSNTTSGAEFNDTIANITIEFIGSGVPIDNMTFNSTSQLWTYTLVLPISVIGNVDFRINTTSPVLPANLSATDNFTALSGVNFSGFDGATTNFSQSGLDLQHLSYPIIENASAGKVVWEGTDINVSGANFSQNLLIADNIVSMNTSKFDQTLNSSANITLYNVGCTDKIYYKEGFPQDPLGITTPGGGSVCNATSNPSCTNIQCSGKNVSFTTSHFTGFATKAGVSCGDNVILSVSLAGDLICSGTALYIGQDMRTINCKGHSIIGTGSGVGINISGYENINVTNCNIRGFEYGIFSSGSNKTIVENTLLHNNSYGLWFEDASGGNTNNYFKNVVAKNNSVTGLYFLVLSNSILNNITAYNNSQEGIDFEGGSLNNISNITAYNNLFAGIKIFSVNNNSFDNLSLYLNALGVDSSGSNNNTFTNLYAYSNNIGINLETSAENIFKSIELYDNSQYGIRYYNNSDNDNVTDALLHNNSAGSTSYDVFFENISSVYPDSNIFNNLTIYESQKPLGFYDTSWTVSNNFTNLNICYNSSVGCVSWPFLNLTFANLTNNSNILLSSDFVSLNASDTGASQFNKSANVTLFTTTCSNIGHYRKSGFPVSRNDILLTGSQFTPTYKICSGNTAIFTIPDFSGYAVNKTPVGALYSKFGGVTTDFNNVPDAGNVVGAVLENSAYGKIEWNNPINVTNADFDTWVNIGLGFVSLNASAFDLSLNTSANITLYNSDCLNPIIYSAQGFLSTKTGIVNGGSLCNTTTNPSCEILSCAGGNLTFNVSHFTGYAQGANANLTIFDMNDSLGGGFPAIINQQINFTAIYINASDGVAINNDTAGGECNISFDVAPNGPFTMYYNLSNDGNYTYNRSFSTPGLVNWNVTCVSNNFDSLTAVDNVTLQDVDNDGDGFGSFIDCDDANSTIRPLVNNSVDAVSSDVLVCIGNYNSSIRIVSSNIVVDGNGSIIRGSASGYGINNSDGYTNVTIRNFAGINNFSTGVYFVGSGNSTIFNNSIASADVMQGHGIAFIAAIDSNNVTYNTINISGDFSGGVVVFSSDNQSVISNKIFSIGNDAIGVVLNDSSDVFVINNNVTTSGNESYAVGLLSKNYYSNITGNILNTTGNMSYAISLVESNFSNVKSNIVTTSFDEAFGIFLENASNSTLELNNITTFYDASAGIFLTHSWNNVLLSNRIYAYANFSNGISLNTLSNFNNLSFNNITLISGGEVRAGIDVESSYNTTIFKNILSVYDNSSVGVSLLGANFTDVLNNSITTDDFEGFGIILSRNASRNLVYGNDIKTSGQKGFGVLLSNRTAFNNVKSNLVNTTGPNAFGIVVNNALTDNNVSNNTIFFRGLYSGGIFLNNSENVTVYSNTIMLPSSLLFADKIGVGIYGLQNINDLTIMDNNVTLQSGSSTALQLYGSSEVLVSDNLLRTFGNNSHAVFFYNVSSSNLTSNVLETYYNYSDGIHLELLSSPNNIISNNITAMGQHSYALSAYNSTLVNISHNILNTSSNNSYGMLLSNLSVSYLYYNNITTAGNASHGIKADSLSTSDYLTGSIINITGNNSIGLLLSSSNGMLIDGLRIYSEKDDSIPVVFYNSNSSTIQSTTLVPAANAGLYILSTSNRNTLINNTIYNGISDNSSTTNNTLFYTLANGSVNWTGINLSTTVNLSLANPLIKNNFIKANLTGSLNLTTATLIFRDITFEAVDAPLLNGNPCYPLECSPVQKLSVDTYKFNATHFTTYQLSPCAVPVDDLTITRNTTLCSGTYYVNDSADNGLIIVNNNSLTLACNSTTIIGNNFGTGIKMSNYDNLTLRDCILINYSVGVHLKTSVGNNISNNSIDALSNLTDLFDSIGILFEDVNDSLIDSNIIDSTCESDCDGDSAGIIIGSFNPGVGGSFNNTLVGNNITSVSSEYNASRVIGISIGRLDGDTVSSNNMLFNNIISNVTCAASTPCTYYSAGISSTALAGNVSAANNQIRNAEVGMFIGNDNGTWEDIRIDNISFGLSTFGLYRNGTAISNLLVGDNNNLTNIFISNSTSVCIFMANLSSNNIFRNLSCTDTFGTAINDTSNGNNTLIYNNSEGSVNWTGINLSTTVNLSLGYNPLIQNNLIGADINLGLNLTNATLVFKNIPRLPVATLLNDQLCSLPECSGITDLGGGTYSFDVTHFTNYSLNLCAEPIDDLSISSDITLCPGTYYVNDTADDGLVKVSADNINVSCVGTIIIGNSSGTAIYNPSYENFTMSGCTLSNYSFGVELIDHGNHNIFNNNFSWMNNASIYLLNSNKTRVYNNTISRDRGRAGVWVLNSNNVSLDKNVLYNNNFSTSNYGIALESCFDCNITNNYLEHNIQSIFALGSSYAYIFNNTVNFSESEAIRIGDVPSKTVESVIVSNNTLINGLTFGFFAGVVANGKINNLTIEFNNITNNLYDGILLSNTINTTIKNNTLIGNGGNINNEGANNTIIFGNNISFSALDGIRLLDFSSSDMQNNYFCNNNFFDIRSIDSNFTPSDVAASNDFCGNSGFGELGLGWSAQVRVISASANVSNAFVNVTDFNDTVVFTNLTNVSGLTKIAELFEFIINNSGVRVNYTPHNFSTNKSLSSISNLIEINRTRTAVLGSEVVLTLPSGGQPASPSTPSSSGGRRSGSSLSPCSWDCGEWGECVDNKQTRTCTGDSGSYLCNRLNRTEARECKVEAPAAIHKPSIVPPVVKPSPAAPTKPVVSEEPKPIPKSNLVYLNLLWLLALVAIPLLFFSRRYSVADAMMARHLLVTNELKSHGKIFINASSLKYYIPLFANAKKLSPVKLSNADVVRVDAVAVQYGVSRHLAEALLFSKKVKSLRPVEILTSETPNPELLRDFKNVKFKNPLLEPKR